MHKRVQHTSTKQKKTTVRDVWEETGGPVYLINRRVLGDRTHAGAFVKCRRPAKWAKAHQARKRGPCLAGDKESLIKVVYRGRWRGRGCGRVVVARTGCVS